MKKNKTAPLGTLSFALPTANWTYRIWVWFSLSWTRPHQSSAPPHGKGPSYVEVPGKGADGAGYISLHTNIFMSPGMPALGTAPSALLTGAKGSWEPWDLKPLRPGEREPGWGPNMRLHLQPLPSETFFPCTETPLVLTPADTCTASVNVINQIPAKLKCTRLCSLLLLEDCQLLLLICQSSSWIQPCLPAISGPGCCPAICRVTRQSLHGF